jgi:lysozyme|tara:strand:+ start:28 stop:444 length:417 start_codon:yes stop_codon:yes gene_type:complete
MIIEMLRVHEGVETHAYKCTADKTTIGVGRNIDPSGGIGLSSDEIDYLLSNDVKRVSAELIRAFSWYSELDEVRKDAMIDMCFNMGLPRLKLFKKSLAAMANGDYDIAAIEFLDSNWAKQVGGRSIIVTDMIRSGDYR